MPRMRRKGFLFKRLNEKVTSTSFRSKEAQDLLPLQKCFYAILVDKKVVFVVSWPCHNACDLIDCKVNKAREIGVSD